MRVLVCSDTPWRPATAGNRARIAAMLDHLRAGGAQLAACMLPAPDHGEWDDTTMHGEVEPYVVARPPWLARLRERMSPLRRDRGAVPVPLDAWCPRWYQAQVVSMVETWRPQVMLVEYVFLTACAEAVRAGSGRRPRFLLDTHDLMHQRPATYAAVGMVPQWFHTSQADEARGLTRVDAAMAITPSDADALRTLAPNTEVLLVPHAAALFPQPATAAEADCVLYVGSHNDLNVVGLRWFLTEVWPRLRTDRPNATLHVCGNIAAKMGTLPAGVQAHGVVENLAAQYARARVVIEPVPAGTGMKVKVVDALRHGRPVVTTPAGASGVAAGSAHGVLVASDATAFALRIRELLSDAVQWNQMVAAAERQARAQYSTTTAFAALDRWLAA